MNERKKERVPLIFVFPPILILSTSVSGIMIHLLSFLFPIGVTQWLSVAYSDGPPAPPPGRRWRAPAVARHSRSPPHTPPLSTHPRGAGVVGGWVSE